jgi:hypothetical protein
MKLDQVLARVTERDTTGLDDDLLKRTVLETIAALGLEVNTKSGEVYDPAPSSSWQTPEQRNVRWSGRRR